MKICEYSGEGTSKANASRRPSADHVHKDFTVRLAHVFNVSQNPNFETAKFGFGDPLCGEKPASSDPSTGRAVSPRFGSKGIGKPGRLIPDDHSIVFFRRIDL
jgi:hypothetical protein